VKGPTLALDAWFGEMLRLWATQLAAFKAYLEARP
jgi:hypothetical protein